MISTTYIFRDLQREDNLNDISINNQHEIYIMCIKMKYIRRTRGYNIIWQMYDTEIYPGKLGQNQSKFLYVKQEKDFGLRKE